MKSIFSFLTLVICLSLQVYGQKVNSDIVLGEYTWSTGTPGRKIYKSDSSYTTITPEIYITTTIKLRRFGRVIQTTEAYHGMGLNSKYRGVWKMENDTLTISLPTYEEKYLVVSSKLGVSLKSLTSNLILTKNRD